MAQANEGREYVHDSAYAAIFPTIKLLPDATRGLSAADVSRKWWMVADIKGDLSAYTQKPSLLVSDRAGQDFAVVFTDSAIDFKERKLKRGNTIVIPQARRTPVPGDEGQFLVEVNQDEIANPRLVFASGEAMAALKADESLAAICPSCGNSPGASLKKCTGCQIVGYCSMECQRENWNGGHKMICKMMKSIHDIWPSLPFQIRQPLAGGKDESSQEWIKLPVGTKTQCDGEGTHQRAMNEDA